MGRDYTKAYARFEQSLGTTDYPVHLPSTAPTYHVPLPTPARSKSFAERLRSSDVSRSRPSKPTVETHLLPPTPPPSFEPHDPSFGLSNRLTTPELTPDTRHGTPFTNLEAPTPNTTPPSPGTYSAVKHPRGLSYDSSRAESFRTAPEDVSPRSECESPIELPLQGVRRIDNTPETSMEVYELGLKSFDRVTENAHRKIFQELDLKTPSKEEVDTLGSIRSSKTSTSMRKRRRVDHAPAELTFLEDPGQMTMKSPSNQESPSSWLDGSSSGENSPVDGMSQPLASGGDHRLTTPESRILPSSSDASPVVEALIVDSPPRQHRPLRHVSKNRELRRSPAQSKCARVLGTLEGSTQDPAPSQSVVTITKDHLASTDKQSGDQSSHPELDRDLVTTARARSLLTPRVPASLRAKWRRSAPGLSSRGSPSGIGRDLMEAVPEDKPLPESPQPPATLDVGGNTGPSLRRGSEHSMAPSEKSGSRLGVDRLGDTPSARNTFARSSPVSDASDALVRDATAVSLYPHHNDSLLVVENSGSSNNASKETHTILSRITSTEEDIDSPPETQTPARKRNSRNVESPLTNPRRPPEPPLVAVVPPTPAKTEDADPNSPVSPNHDKPFGVRQSSISQRAKRYSDSLATSLSRFASGGRSRAPNRASMLQPVSPASDYGHDLLQDTLHSTWKARGFLNEIGFNAPARTRQYAYVEPSSTEDLQATENAPPSYVEHAPVRTERLGSIRRFLSARTEKDWNSSGPQENRGDMEGSKFGSQRRGVTYSFRRRLQERSIRREEERREERQEKLRHSIGARFYVEHDGFK